MWYTFKIDNPSIVIGYIGLFHGKYWSGRCLLHSSCNIDGSEIFVVYEFKLYEYHACLMGLRQNQEILPKY